MGARSAWTAMRVAARPSGSGCRCRRWRMRWRRCALASLRCGCWWSSMAPARAHCCGIIWNPGGCGQIVEATAEAALAHLAAAEVPFTALIVGLALDSPELATLLAGLAQRPEDAALPRLLLADLDEKGLGLRAREFGFGAYLTKPGASVAAVRCPGRSAGSAAGSGCRTIRHWGEGCAGDCRTIRRWGEGCAGGRRAVSPNSACRG